MKYRIWDRESKTYNNKALFVAQDGKVNQGIYLMQEQDNYIIEQYTGINDINGNEIYVGDIIKVIEEDYYLNYYIVWDKEFLEFSCKYLSGDNWDNLYEVNECNDIEIIGNIHIDNTK